MNPETATPEARLRRLKIRGWRRGTKEMDMILGPYADALLEGRERADLDALEALMDENDQDLYLWVSRAREAPAEHEPALAEVRRFHGLA
ncbi:succinate dehydrogenase assembly factor 2 [uncultured Albimonas sp.]|uniref:succinate dehydrogenase assembly factor 2 n=1 Tax=uncultured Albimonas sp. TaxID=1331701 RepID=UPI0030EB6291|tara:strand:+ start:4063 stop:4332 length:270 start_codon:yes stop_codon:yes gene_type:complete